MSDSSMLLNAAFDYVAQGFKVFPLKPGGKTPITAHGVKDATQLPATVKEYWRKYPNANIGLSCDGLLVLDYDGKAGAESKRQLITKHGELPRTWVIKTGGGTHAEPKEQGEHYVYKVPTDLNIRPGAGKYGYQNLDIRANDSYIVAAPSITRLPYETIDSSPVTDAPGWLIDIATKRRDTNKAAQTEVNPDGQPIPDGQRNDTLTSLAGIMRRRGMTQPEIETALLTINQQRCQPPLDESEIRCIATSVSRYTPDKAMQHIGVESEHNQNNGHRPELRYLDTVEAREIKFLWNPYIPIGKLTLLEGDPGVGKSWITLAITTAVSLGHGLPPVFGPNEIGYALIASAEDGLSDTIKPRLELMKAEVTNICAIDGLFTLDDDGFKMLEGYIIKVKPILVVIDPLVAYISGEMDINRANQVRHATARLARLAGKHNLAMLAVRHLTKGASLKPLYRGLGSIDFTASARSALLAGNDPEDSETRGIVHIKSNLSPRGNPIGYKITKESVFEWLSTSSLTAEQLLSAGEGSHSQLNIAKAFLTDVLSGGPQSAKDVYSEAESQGISKGTLNRAKQDLKIISYNQPELGKRGAGKWCMRLPREG